MANVLIVAYLLIVLAMIAVILLQRSEGGALGMGGGTGGGLVSARGSANLLSRTTAILAGLFMATAISLSIVASIDNDANSILDNAEAVTAEDGTVLDALNSLQPADNSLAIPEANPAPETDISAPQGSELPVPEVPATSPTGGANN